mmetsp:Transcript_45558/g.115742  ORF Transcript_45558/g.115742 Transcript_45558/m.115742 type:complete len:269 (-) Transcript_45558:1296-2102(-)
MSFRPFNSHSAPEPAAPPKKEPPGVTTAGPPPPSPATPPPNAPGCGICLGVTGGAGSDQPPDILAVVSEVHESQVFQSAGGRICSRKKRSVHKDFGDADGVIRGHGPTASSLGVASGVQEEAEEGLEKEPELGKRRKGGNCTTLMMFCLSLRSIKTASMPALRLGSGLPPWPPRQRESLLAASATLSQCPRGLLSTSTSKLRTTFSIKLLPTMSFSITTSASSVSSSSAASSSPSATLPDVNRTRPSAGDCSAMDVIPSSSGSISPNA